MNNGGLTATVIQVNHSAFGTLFAGMIKGSGNLICDEDEEGNAIPFFTTDQILTELQRFGFYVTYDVKSNLPMNTLSFLATVDNLGYDKITRVALETFDKLGQKKWKPTILLIKSEANPDLLEFDCKLVQKKFQEKLAANTIMNVTDEPNLSWDWVAYIANISDILDENVDPVDEFITDSNIESGKEEQPAQPPFPPHIDNEGFTAYEEPDDSEEDTEED